MQIRHAHTALLLVDFQVGIIASASAPHSGSVALANAARLAAACRARRMPVVLLQASAGSDGRLGLDPPRDLPMPAIRIDATTMHIAPELGPLPGDIVVTKYNWGGFYGTDLGVQLRRRGIDTIILCGIATNFGVEGTARQAHERGLAQIVVEDACAAFSREDHAYPFAAILPRIAQVRRTDQVLAALA